MSQLGKVNWHQIDENFSVNLIEPRKQYLIRTNGMEWRDHDLKIELGTYFLRLLLPEIIRGRPIAYASIDSDIEWHYVNVGDSTSLEIDPDRFYLMDDNDLVHPFKGYGVRIFLQSRKHCIKAIAQI